MNFHEAWHEHHAISHHIFYFYTCTIYNHHGVCGNFLEATLKPNNTGA